jgi:hypothetical protein
LVLGVFHQNLSCISFGRFATESTPRGRDFICLRNNMGISKVDSSQNGMVMLKTMPPNVFCCADDCGMVDLPLADCARMTATAVMNQGIFAVAFSEEWTEAEPESQAHTVVIDHVI